MTGPAAMAQRALYANDGSGAAYTPTSEFDRTLRMNPGVGFAEPDAWFGPRPVYFSDTEYLRKRESSGNWLTPGDSLLTPRGSYPESAYQFAVPAGASRFWEMPAYRGAQMFDQSQFADNTAPLSSAALEAKFGTAATNQANREMMAGATTLTPSPLFTLPTKFIPPITGNSGDRYLANGVTTDGTGKVLNANRPAEERMTAPPVMTADTLHTSSGDPQKLPTNNTTATSLSSFDWKRYAPFVLVALACVLLFALMARRKRSSD